MHQVNYIHGWTYDLGIQIHDTLTIGQGAGAKDYEWVLGATLTPASNLSVEQSYILRSLPIGSTSGIKDTVFENLNSAGTINAPMSWKAGGSFGQIEKWQIAADAVVVNGGIVSSEAQFGGLQRKVAYVNSNWYAFYNDGTDIFWKKSADGITWGSANNLDASEDNDADNYTRQLIHRVILYMWPILMTALIRYKY